MRHSLIIPIAIGFLATASFARAQSDNPPGPRKPELPEVQALWLPYQDALKAVEADRDKKLKNLDYIYMLNLDKMQKDRSAAGDLVGALAVKAELGRLGARQETTTEQIKAMNPALQKLRTAYDTALRSYNAEAAKSNATLLQKLLTDLEEVQRRITTTGDLEKALLVKAEKERLAAEAAPEVKVAPVPVPEPVKVPPVVSSPGASYGHMRTATATKEQPFMNSLGMRFVPVPIAGGPSGGQRVLFSIWETRVQDYEAYAKAKGVKLNKPEFPQGATHPVVNITCEEAQAFCAWLTEREWKDGRLGTAERYRLPSDHEWSCAVGIGEQEDPAKSPESKSGKIPDIFPWGTDWPPSVKSGNFKGEEAEKANTGNNEKPIKGYNDGFAYTSAVGSFPPNRFGIYDLGGNVSELCDDFFSPNRKNFRVQRGESFAQPARSKLVASHRMEKEQDVRTIRVGFRVVVSAAGPAR